MPLPQVLIHPSCAKLAPLGRNSTEFLCLSRGTAGLDGRSKLSSFDSVGEVPGSTQTSGLSSGLTLEPALNEQNRFCGYSLDEERAGTGKAPACAVAQKVVTLGCLVSPVWSQEWKESPKVGDNWPWRSCWTCLCLPLAILITCLFVSCL